MVSNLLVFFFFFNFIEIISDEATLIALGYRQGKYASYLQAYSVFYHL